MKCPKRRSWRSSQVSASFGSSGAGPYSIVTNFSAMLMWPCSFLCADLFLPYGTRSFANATQGCRPGLHYCAALRLTALDKAVTQSDADNPPSTALLRGARADVQCHSKGCWLRDETVLLSSTACPVLLSSEIAIRWIASPCGSPQPA